MCSVSNGLTRAESANIISIECQALLRSHVAEVLLGGALAGEGALDVGNAFGDHAEVKRGVVAV